MTTILTFITALINALTWFFKYKLRDSEINISQLRKIEAECTEIEKLIDEIQEDLKVCKSVETADACVSAVERLRVKLINKRREAQYISNLCFGDSSGNGDTTD